MSTALVGSKGAATRAYQAIILVVLFGVMFVAKLAAPGHQGHAGTVAAVGFLLLAGTLASELVEVIGLPHLSGYMVAGIIAGPYVLDLIDHQSVEELSSVNSLALALIALEGGAELKIGVLRSVARSLVWSTILNSVVGFLLMTGVFLLLGRYMPFTRSLAFPALFGTALLWATLAITRSPSATLGILSQTRAQGPIATFTLAFVMASDVVVLLLLAVVFVFVRPLFDPGAGFSTAELVNLGHELVGSVALGTTLGLVLAIYVKLIGRQLILVFVALGFGATEVLRYLQLDPLLTFIVAGFVVQNLSAQGGKFLHGIERTGGVVYVIFFATTGAHLNVPLFRALWPVAVALCAARAAITWASSRWASSIAKDTPVVRAWGWSGLVSQAGVALGIAAIIEKSFPTIGASFRALAIAAVGVNEAVGPVLFKLALDRSGETSVAPPPVMRSSLTDVGKG